MECLHFMKNNFFVFFGRLLVLVGLIEDTIYDEQIFCLFWSVDQQFLILSS